MKSLILIRHGIAEEYCDWDGPDATRPLTDKGITRFQNAARGVAPFLSGVDLLLTSPYVRARQTAEILGSVLECECVEVPELACGVDGRKLAAYLDKLLASRESIIYVGHEPDLSTAIQVFLNASAPPVLVKKGSITCLEQYSDRSYQLQWHLSPKLSRALGGQKG